MLVEVEAHIKQQMEDAKVIEALGEENIFLAQPVLGASIEQALDVAVRWIDETSS